MRKAGWDVLSLGRACQLTMRVDLVLVERVSGPQAVLWNRQARCRRIGCDGVVEFWGKNPKITNYIRLRAGWPDD
jgi:hypothetical protein